MAEAVRNAVTEGLTPRKERVCSIAYDNGRGFADHEGMATDIETRVYFAHPYAFWERGLDGNTNGFIRHYFQKHRDQMTVSEDEIHKVMDNPNHCPRKSLSVRTPCEVFFKFRASLAVALHN
ncbi:MAG: IS30 family transposase [Gammaproteobacteria bacterium]